MTKSRKESDIMSYEGNKRKGLIEWIPFLLTATVVGGGIIVGYATLRADFRNKCDQFVKDIERIETSGSSVSTANREQIAVIRTRLDGIDKQLGSIDTKQDEVLKLMQRISNNRTGTVPPAP